MRFNVAERGCLVPGSQVWVLHCWCNYIFNKPNQFSRLSRQLCGWKGLVAVRGQQSDSTEADHRKAAVSQVTASYNQSLSSISELTTPPTWKQSGHFIWHGVQAAVPEGVVRGPWAQFCVWWRRQTDYRLQIPLSRWRQDNDAPVSPSPWQPSWSSCWPGGTQMRTIHSWTCRTPFFFFFFFFARVLGPNKWHRIDCGVRTSDEIWSLTEIGHHKAHCLEPAPELIAFWSLGGFLTSCLQVCLLHGTAAISALNLNML